LGAVAIAIIVGDSFIKGCGYMYQNRRYFAAKANAYRNSFGSYFVYA